MSRRGVVLGAGVMAAGMAGAVGLGLRSRPAPRYPGLPRRPAAASARVAPVADPANFGPVTGRVTSPDGAQRFTAIAATRWARSLAPRPAASVQLRPDTTRQRFEGAGASLTQASVGLLRGLPAGRRAVVLRRLFDPAVGAGISLIRQPLGSSDFSNAAWTYADRPARVGSAVSVSVGDEDDGVLAMVRDALHLNPRLQVIGTPWTAPAWMKTNGSLIGGTLKAVFHGAYAQYLADVATAYEREGVFLTAISLQNEPGFAPPDYPGMTLSPTQQADLVRVVGPALARAGSATRLLLLDHNWSDIPTVLPLLRDPQVRRWAMGTAVHGYNGFPGQQRLLSDAAPELQIWETECSGGTWAPDYGPDLTWDAHTLVVQGMRNGSSSVVFWNVALDRAGGPSLNGGSTCRGVVTVDRVTHEVTANVEYDVLRHLRVLVPGARRIESEDPAGVETAAWRNPDGSFVVFATAPSAQWRGWLRVGDRSAPVTVPQGGLCTFLWSDGELRARPGG